MDCWLPRFCQLREESRWSKFDEDDAGFYEEWTEERCLERFLLLWVGKERCGAHEQKQMDDCDEDVSSHRLVEKMNREEKSRTTAIGIKECGGKENHNVIPRILGAATVKCHVEEWSVALRPCQLTRAIADAVAGSLGTTGGKKIFRGIFYLLSG